MISEEHRLDGCPYLLGVLESFTFEVEQADRWLATVAARGDQWFDIELGIDISGERISLEDAIKAYTLGAAFAGHRETSEGSLEPGKLADLIVLQQDLFKIEPTEIAKTKVLMTMVGGKVVYQASEWTQAKASGGEAN